MVCITQKIMIIEGLVLDHVEQNKWYTLTCLPLKLEGCEGSPARCILTREPEPMGEDVDLGTHGYMDSTEEYTGGYANDDSYGSSYENENTGYY